jgi:hypothetical protein
VALEWLNAVREVVWGITRVRLDAALYQPAPPRKPGQNGGPRQMGARLPTLAEVADNPTTTWTTIMTAHWHGPGKRRVPIASATAVWYHTGMPPPH